MNRDDFSRRPTRHGGDHAGQKQTGFPRVFYLRYHLYRLYFPVMAIGRYLTAHGVTAREPGAVKMSPKLMVG